MKPLIRSIVNGLTIDLDIKDIDGNETLTTSDANKLLAYYIGYIDGDRRQLVIFGGKTKCKE